MCHYLTIGFILQHTAIDIFNDRLALTLLNRNQKAPIAEETLNVTSLC